MKIYHITDDNVQTISSLLKDIDDVADGINDIDNEGAADIIKSFTGRIDRILDEILEG